MEIGNKRQVCSFCDQELAHTSFHRHLHDTAGSVCPGKRRKTIYEDDSDSDRESIVNSISPRGLDSTFDLGSSDYTPESEDGDLLSEDGGLLSEDGGLSIGISYDTDSSINTPSDSEYSSDSGLDGEEIWDDSEDETHQVSSKSSANTVVAGIYYFLAYYQLLYHLSERAINSLLSFIRLLLHYIGAIANHNVLREIAQALPKVMSTIRNSFKQDEYIEYVVCPKCCTLYNISESVINGDTSKRCSFVEFPNHPHLSKRSACGEILLKKVKVGNKYKLVPRKSYIYRSIVTTLKELARRKGFLDMCNQWQNRSKEHARFIGDIYDGKVWDDFKEIGGRPFLTLPNNLCLALNIDWFRLYKHSPYSVGAIYLVVLNLPRNERFKEENVILAGIMPGPNEPKRINPFLSPIVQDFISLYEGISFESTSSFLGSTFIRATLACIVCDIPATRKVCGFANFNGTLGCSKCLKKFVTASFGSKPQYGGFNCASWKARDISSHKQHAQKFKKATTASSCQKITRETGIKYSELLRIPHLDIVRLHVIDPMHNIFLGLAKHTVKIWKEKGILQSNQFVQLQTKADMITTPTGIGRIPRKLESNFSSFTADEWKNWILIFSVHTLKGVVDEQHYKCWCLLVDSCVLLCQYIITEQQINQAHVHLVEFCQQFEILYGSECCTPNMHLACHLKECLLDFGPFSAFWCFPFERYNGILEGISKSWMQPEKQMFLKFSQKQKLKFLCTDLENDFLNSVAEETLTLVRDDSGSVGQTSAQDLLIMQQTKEFTCAVANMDAEIKTYQCLMPPIKEKYFGDAELGYLREMYKVLYPTAHTDVPRLYKECKKITINHTEYISTKARSQKSCAIAAKWPGVIGIDSRGEAPLRIGQVMNFLEHTVTFINSATVHVSTASYSKTHILARVQWYCDHPRRNYLHSSAILCSTVFDHESCAYFIPVSRIMCPCAITSTVSLKFDYGTDNVLVAVPLRKFIDSD